MRDFEAARAELDGEVDEAFDLVDVAAMDHRIDGQREAEPADLLGEFHLDVVGAA